MKLLMSWTISFLLSVQPAMVWAGTKTASPRSEINNEIKNYLNKTGLTRKSMSVQEFYNNNKDLFDDAERASLEKMVKENGNVKIPKMDVTTVKNKAGEEVYQLQAVADGQSTSITLFGDQEEFVRVNGVGISVKEGLSVEKTMAKLGTPKEAMDYYFRGPASVDGNRKKSKARKPSNAGKLLSAEQVMKMNLEQKQKYLQQLRQLMESVESVQNAFNESPHGANLQNDFFQHVAGLMLGDLALAEESQVAEGEGTDDGVTATPGNTCVIAGNISTQGFRKNGNVKKWQTCGRDSSGKVISAIKGNCGEKIQCNPALYGEGNFCVTPGKTSTADCNNLAKQPIDFKDVEAYNKFKTQADGVIQQAKATCGADLDGNGGDVAAIKINNMKNDQANACKNLKERAATLNSWCSGDKKPKYCEAPAATTPAQPATPTPAAGTSGSLPKCSELKTQKGFIENGSVEKCDLKDSSMRIYDKECVADDNVHLSIVQMCVCVGDYHESSTSGKFKCIKGDSSSAASTGGDTDKPKKKSFWSKTKGVFSSIGSWFGDHKKFFINLGVGLAVTGLVYKLAKKSTKAYYNNLDPVAPVAPITVPTVPPAREGAY